MKKTYNPKIYLYLEDVLSHYQSKEDCRALYFYENSLFLPVMVGKDGKIWFYEQRESEDGSKSGYKGITLKLGDSSLRFGSSLSKHIYWDSFIKTEEVVYLLNKLAKAGVRFGEEIKAISDFIDSFGKPWISHLFGGYLKRYNFQSIDRNFYRSGGDKKDLEEKFLDLVKDMEKGGLVKTIFEDGIIFNQNEFFRYIKLFRKDHLDFELDGTEENFSDISYRSGEIFVDTFERVFQSSYIYHEKTLAMIYPLGEGGREFNIKFYKPQKNYPLLRFDEKELTEAGALVLYPEFIRLDSGRDEEVGAAIFILDTPPKSAELGLLYIGADYRNERKLLTAERGEEKVDEYWLIFAPFIAADSEILLRVQEVYYNNSSHELSEISTRYLPVITISRKEPKDGEKEKTKKPKLQLYSFSFGPRLLALDSLDEKERVEAYQVYLYSPLFEYVSFGREGDNEEAKVFRGSFWKSEEINRYHSHSKYPPKEKYEDDYRTFFMGLVEDLDLLVAYGIEKIKLDLLSYKKVEKMTRISKEILRSYTGKEGERGIVELARIEEGVEEYSALEEYLCFLGEGENKVIIYPLGEIPEVYKKMSRIGVPLIGSASLPRYYDDFYFPDDPKNKDREDLYHPNIYWYMRFMLGKAFEIKGGGWANSVYRALERPTLFMKHVELDNKIQVKSEEVGSDSEVMKKARSRIKSAPHEASAVVLQTLNKISSSLGEGVYLTIVVDYAPIVKKEFGEYIYDDDEGGKVYPYYRSPEYDDAREPKTPLERARNNELPKLIEIYSVVRAIYMVFDLKEEGVRLVVGASPNPVTNDLI